MMRGSFAISEKPSAPFTSAPGLNRRQPAHGIGLGAHPQGGESHAQQGEGPHNARAIHGVARACVRREYPEAVPHFMFEGQRIAYTEYGGGPAAVTSSGARGRTARSAPAGARPLILIHGLLLSQEMHRPLAEDLAARGNRVITIDLLGHGKSDRPRDMWRYSMSIFGEQVIALMDHLRIEQAVVMGTSLGANTALEIASVAPERLRGMVIEMPVLDNGLLGSALTFTPLLVALTFGEPAMKLLARGTRAVPRRLLPHYGNVVLDLVRQEPGPSGALIQGLFFGRIAPHRSERHTFQMPALVLGHHRRSEEHT